MKREGVVNIAQRGCSSQLNFRESTHTSSLITSSHLSVSSVELQKAGLDIASFVCVCVRVVRVALSSWVSFVGAGVAGLITDYCELFVCSLYLRASTLDPFHTRLT